MAIAFGSAIVFGVAPAWQVSRISDLRSALGEGTRAPGGRATRRALVVAEVALAFSVIVGAGLLVRSFARLTAADAGFATSHRLTMRITLPVLRYPRETTVRAAFYAQLFERLWALPGVTAAGGVSELPLGELKNMGSFDIQGRPTPRGQDEPHGDWRSASAGYFRATGIALVRGRTFSDRDGAGAPPVVVVDEEAARRLWPAGDALGARISIDDPPLWREVVGVVRSVHHDALDRPSRLTVYFSLAQRPTPTSFAVIDAAGDPAALAAAARATARAIDPELPVYDVRTLENRLGDSLGRRRVAMWLLVAFGSLALLLSAVGVYGVLAYDVSQRRHEIGIRMALGAGRGRVLQMVIASGVTLTIAGVGVGVVIAAIAARAASGLLFGVSPYDPITYVGLAALLIATAIGAAYFPARRATAVDPMVALRQS
jgi:putative ABC transport system permease protein